MCVCACVCGGGGREVSFHSALVFGVPVQLVPGMDYSAPSSHNPFSSFFSYYLSFSSSSSSSFSSHPPVPAGVFLPPGPRPCPQEPARPLRGGRGGGGLPRAALAQTSGAGRPHGQKVQVRRTFVVGTHGCMMGYGWVAGEVRGNWSRMREVRTLWMARWWDACG